MNMQIYQDIVCFPTNKLAFIDIDNTLTANPWDTDEKDLLDGNLTNQALDLLKKQNYLCILSTSRTEEMCMSSTQYELSKKKYPFHRPPPHLGIIGDKKRFYIKPEEYFPINLIDSPIIISSSGAKISAAQKNGGYREDKDFYPAGFPNPQMWRKEIVALLSMINIEFKYSSVESEVSYFENKIDIYPADYRITLHLESQDNLLRLTEQLKKFSHIFLTNDSNPDKNIFQLYITPKHGKIDAVEHIIKQLIQQWNLSTDDLEILIIGDSLPDLEAGIKVEALSKSNITFFLVGGSRLTPYLLDKEKNNFAGIDMSFIKQNMTLLHQKGQYLYTDPKTKHIRTIIISDEAFPQSVGPRSIVEFMKNKSYNYSNL